MIELAKGWFLNSQAQCRVSILSLKAPRKPSIAFSKEARSTQRWRLFMFGNELRHLKEDVSCQIAFQATDNQLLDTRAEPT